MEAFPHSGAQLASVHPCKHASVMKKFIDRMESAQGDTGSPGPSGGDKSGSGGGGKKKWGLGGMVRRVTGSGGPEKDKDTKKDKEGSDGSVEEQATGLQVDFYLVIVSSLLMARCPTSIRVNDRADLLAVLEIHREYRAHHRGKFSRVLPLNERMTNLTLSRSTVPPPP